MQVLSAVKPTRTHRPASPHQPRNNFSRVVACLGRERLPPTRNAPKPPKNLLYKTNCRASCQLLQDFLHIRRTNFRSYALCPASDRSETPMVLLLPSRPGPQVQAPNDRSGAPSGMMSPADPQARITARTRMMTVPAHIAASGPFGIFFERVF